MSFAFTEPTATHPTAEEVAPVEETKEVTTDALNDDTDSAGTDADQPDGDDNPGDENAGGEADGGDGAEGAPEGDQPKPDDSKEPGEVSYFFGDEAVTIDIDASHREAFTEKGLDIDALAAELYREGGDFTLSPESLQKCYDAFGKFAIDAFLSGLKAQNDATVAGWKHEAEARVQADAERFTSLCTDIGGEEGWGRLESFALETLSDDELAAFNEVMASGNQYLQQYAVRELEGRRKQAQGDDKVDLIEGNAAPSTDADSGPLNARDYIKATAELGSKFPHDKVGYAKAQAALDARRRAGQSAGL